MHNKPVLIFAGGRSRHTGVDKATIKTADGFKLLGQNHLIVLPIDTPQSSPKCSCSFESQTDRASWLSKTTLGEKLVKSGAIIFGREPKLC
jgi:molybdopterin-guanine dinucleotide biosynthesis protein A